MGETGRKEAVDLFFEFINKDPPRFLEGAIDSLFYEFACATANLYDQHGMEVESYLDKMIMTGDDTKIEAGKRLRQKIQEIHLEHNRS
ncbi:hypothetical protein MUO98_06930 [Candidatus Bathyarchaeota archaeon]|nr:hypothetical protein [Candidatus Bathyarchaeota archaeon]